jgi:hypothetical protein
MRPLDLEAKDVIMCCLLRAIAHFTGIDISVSNNGGLSRKRKSNKFG